MPKRKGSRPTLSDVARSAGVSAQTASNVVRGRYELMRPETRVAVETAMRQLGYYPNIAAQGLRSARTGTLGFLVLDEAPRYLADPLTALMIAGVGDVLREANYGLLVQAERPEGKRRDLLKPVREGRVDGAFLLLSGDRRLRSWYVDQMADSETPFVVFDELIEDTRTLVVRSSERAASRELTTRVLQAGKRRLGFIAAQAPWPVLEERYRGFCDAHQDAGVELQEDLHLFEATWEGEGGYEMASRLLSLPEPPTALICGSDALAVGAMTAIRHSGRKVPTDVAVVGFDDFDFARFVDPPLTTVAVPAYEMGRIAARMLIDRLSGQPIPTPHIVLQNEIRWRASV